MHTDSHKHGTERKGEIYFCNMNKGVAYAWKTKTKRKIERISEGMENNSTALSNVSAAYTNSKTYMSNGTELILSYAFKLHTCMTNKMKFARFSMRCVCVSVCAMHCAHCACEHTCIFKFRQHIIYTCRVAAAAAAATNVELWMFLHPSVCMDDTHPHPRTHIRKWWWYTDALQ